MSKKFRNKYRISSPRIPWFDYSSNATYFITICTKNRIEFLGSIENDRMILSPIGLIVQKEWDRTPALRPELNLIMDNYVIMPNHVHGIIVYRGARPGISITRNPNKFGPQKNNIPSIIRGIKSSVTIQARKTNPDFSWQRGYFAHIVRNKKEYNRIIKYIRDNPKNYKG
ncbi:MAG: hypothetical protein K9J25_05495 [Bacteroidales bacterium]|nr:hypothetical protein [Bacteroidales bacterium]